MAQIENTYRV